MRIIEDIADERSERNAASEYIAAIIQEFFRDGSCDIRVQVTNVPRDEWEELHGKRIRRFPDGDVKVETVCHGVVVEWVPAP